MKTISNQALLKIALAAMAVVSVSRYAAAQWTLDDFSTGPYSKTLKKGEDNNHQSGSMVGGTRGTALVACSPSSACKNDNPFNQPSSFDIQPATKTTPSALVFNSGYKADSYLDISYGYGTPMTLDFSGYDRIRINFDAVDQVVNFNLLVFSNGGALYSQTGCNLVDTGLLKSFSVDFPFADFTPGGHTPGADFTGINYMVFIFDEAQGAYSGEDWAVTSFQAIPVGAPPADITCNGLGT